MNTSEDRNCQWKDRLPVELEGGLGILFADVCNQSAHDCELDRYRVESKHGE